MANAERADYAQRVGADVVVSLHLTRLRTGLFMAPLSARQGFGNILSPIWDIIYYRSWRGLV